MCHSRLFRSLLTGALTLAALAACDSSTLVSTQPDTPATPDNPPASVPAPEQPAGPPAMLVLAPRNVALPVGTTLALDATAKDGRGVTVTGAIVHWTSTDSSVIRVDGSGRITAGTRVGSARIVATAGASADTAEVAVTAGVAVGVDVPRDTLMITLGESAEVTVMLHDAYGNDVVPTSVRFASESPEIVQVAPDGRLLARRAGLTQVEVVAGAPVPTSSVSLARRQSDGVASMTESAPGLLRADMVIVVTPLRPAHLVLAPQAVALERGQSATVSATASAASGAALPGQLITWRSTNPAVATVAADGTVRALQPGQARIIGATAGLADTTVVTVTAAPVVAIGLSTSSLALRAGQTASLTATPIDASGQAVAGAAVTWTSSAPSVAVVNASGVVSGVAGGEAQLRATAGNASATVNVTVTAPPPPIRDSVVLEVADFGTLQNHGGASVLFDGVFLAGDAEADDAEPYQALAEYLWGTIPRDAAIERATVTIVSDPAGVWGAPRSLGALVAERAHALDTGVRDGAATSTAAVFPTAGFGVLTADVTGLVREARTAGDATLLLRVRFVQGTNRNGVDDVLELLPGRVVIVYTRPAGEGAVSVSRVGAPATPTRLPSAKAALHPAWRTRR